MGSTNTILNFISLKPNPAPHLHAHHRFEYLPSKLKSILSKLCAGFFSIMITIVSIVLTGGEVNMAALGWLLSGGRRREIILTDANLFCVHALMCVNRQSRPWDQLGPCSDYHPRFELNPHPPVCPADMMLRRSLLTPRPSSRPLSNTVRPHYVSALDPHKTGELTSTDRRLSPPAREVTAFNAVPRGEGDSHLCHVYGAQAHQCGIVIEL